MCIGGNPQVVQPAPVVQAPTPTRRKAGSSVASFQRRNRTARGVFGNIFTSPLGTMGGANSTKATTLGSTVASF
jgi:hypothetical protein